MNLAVLMGTLMSGGSTGGSWNLDTFLGGLDSGLSRWLGIALGIVGLVMMGVGVYKGAKKLISQQGGQQISWITVIALVAIGALLMTLTVADLTGLGQGVTDTGGSLGTGGGTGP